MMDTQDIVFTDFLGLVVSRSSCVSSGTPESVTPGLICLTTLDISAFSSQAVTEHCDGVTEMQGDGDFDLLLGGDISSLSLVSELVTMALQSSLSSTLL